MIETRRVALLLVLALPLAAALGWWLRPSTAAPDATDAAEVASLQHQLALQRQETDARLARIERLLADRAVAQGGAAPVPTPAEVAAQKERVHQRAIANRQRLAQTFASGAAGPRSPGEEKRVRDITTSPFLRELPDQPVDTDVQCRARMCAIRVVFGPGTDAEGWTTRLSLALAPQYGNGRVAVMTTPNGDVEATLYTVPPGNENLIDLR